jgi:hypothetical protein
MSAAVPVDPSRCPLCGAGNGCAMEAERATGEKQPPCWCTRVDFNRDVLEAIPPAARRRACICEACATQAVPAR